VSGDTKTSIKMGLSQVLMAIITVLLTATFVMSYDSRDRMIASIDKIERQFEQTTRETNKSIKELEKSKVDKTQNTTEHKELRDAIKEINKKLDKVLDEMRRR
jgi:septal ring factor EnvC (AmiA/AmiB activator)